MPADFPGAARGSIIPIVPAAALLAECNARIDVAIDASAGGRRHAFAIGAIGAIAWNAPATALDAPGIIDGGGGRGASHRGSTRCQQSRHDQHRVSHDLLLLRLRRSAPGVPRNSKRYRLGKGSGSRLTPRA